MSGLFTDQQTAALLAGLRLLQATPSSRRGEMEHFDVVECPTDDQIDELCDTINNRLHLQDVVTAMAEDQDDYDRAAIAAARIAIENDDAIEIDDFTITSRCDTEEDGCFVLAWVRVFPDQISAITPDQTRGRES